MEVPMTDIAIVAKNLKSKVRTDIEKVQISKRMIIGITSLLITLSMYSFIDKPAIM